MGMFLEAVACRSVRLSLALVVVASELGLVGIAVCSCICPLDRPLCASDLAALLWDGGECDRGDGLRKAEPQY